MNILIKNGHVVDPANKVDEKLDILISGNRIAGIGKPGSIGSEGAQVMDASGKVVVPGLIDMHVHLREPGYEYKENIATGTAAAKAGGFTSLCCMPNTNPVNDTGSVTEFILSQAAKSGSARVYPVGAVTKGSKGEELAEMGELHGSGCVAVSDDGRPVMNGAIMRRAMEYSKIFGIPVLSHCEDANLSAKGVMNEGALSTELGLRGIPSAAEDSMTARDIFLAELTGCRLHLCHVSTKGAVALIREAKARGLAVTAETCPHYFTLTDEAVRGYNTMAKMNPPLRTAEDVQAIKEGLRDGTIDVIATDHAPHGMDEKTVEFEYAPFGIVGLETALGLSLRLVQEGVLSLTDLVRKMSLNPAVILKINRGTLSSGAEADITIIDPDLEWTVDAAVFKSRSRNTPFDGWKLKGRAVQTIMGGRV
ncbi:MAG: dihydroorotase [Nitrospirae bacterium GWC2_57_13]|nr:MAG: dihydroorotase [Nitrospirae bacterium GWC2_57_13]HAR46251.1 dihydroorotase [Nitrospiraceae bacterium]